MSRKIKAPFKGIVTLFNINGKTSRKNSNYGRKITALPAEGRSQRYPAIKIVHHRDGERYWVSPALYPGAEVLVMAGDRVKKGTTIALYPRPRKDDATRKELDVVARALKGKKVRPLTRSEKDLVNANMVKTALERQSWPCRYGRKINTGASYGLVELDFFANENDTVIKVDIGYVDQDDGQEFYLIRMPFPERKAKPWVVYTEGMRCDIDPQKTAYRAWLEILDGLGIDPDTTTDVTDYAEEDEDESGPHGFHFHE